MDKHCQSEQDIIVVGSGLAGLSAADELCDAGYSVLLIDKGRGIGGRLATRRIANATFDYGAQFFTARSSRFKDCVKEWIKAGIAEEWYSSYPGNPNGHPRYRGVPTMTAVAKHLAQGKNLLQATRVERLVQIPSGWEVHVDTNQTFKAKALLITCPVPQILTLLSTSDIAIPENILKRLQTIEYERCIAVMASLDAPSDIAPPGALYFDQGAIAWISDNQQKGLSEKPAITVHASATFSLENFDRDRQKVGHELLDIARPHIGNSQIIDFQVHGWRFSKPTIVDNSESILITQSTQLPPIAVAGDAFAGPRFEGAVVSGWSAGKQLIKALKSLQA